MTTKISPGGGAASPLAALLFLFAAIMTADIVLQPDPVRTQSDATQFDAQAARARMARVLGDQRPHPLDSAAEDEVRERLLAEIRALGFAPEVHEHFTCRDLADEPLECGFIRNIVFSTGPAAGPAILAAAHYDSVPAGPGASDDGIGMAAWLQIAELLRNERLQRRVIFLFSDGEEAGLLGAQAFARSDPLFAPVQAIVNLEARGTRGPASFFETNRPNADAVAAYGAGARRPLANSIMADVYRLLPNSTDISALTRPDLDVVNIAIIDGLEHYHTPRDRLAAQDLASLQHMGDQALGVVRDLAARADAGGRENMVFADIASRVFIAIPETLSRIALGLSAAIALAFFFWRGERAGRWRVLALPIASIIAAGVLSFAIGFGLSTLKPNYWFAHPEFTRAWTALCSLFVLSAALSWLGRGASSAMLAASGALWFGTIGFAGSWALPGLSILFLPASVLYAAGALTSLLWKPAATIAGVLAALAVFVLWAPLVAFIGVALGYDMPFVQAILVVLMLAPWLGLLAGAASSRWITPAIGAATAAAIACAALAPAHTEARPRGLNIVYLLDVSERRARLVAGSTRLHLPPQVRQAAAFSPVLVLPGDDRPAWAAPAPYQNMPAADAAIVSDAIVEGRRTVRLQLAANGAYRLILRVPRSAHPIAARINGVATESVGGPPERDYAYVACSGRSCDGMEIEIVVDGEGGSDPWFVSGFYPGVSPPAEALVSVRPASAVPIQLGDGVYTLRRLPL